MRVYPGSCAVNKLQLTSTSNAAVFHWVLRAKGGKEMDIAATAAGEAGGLIVGKTKLVAVAYGSHYLPLWLKARVCPPASVPGLRPSHRPQLFLLVPVYHLIMCALLTIVVRPVCTCWEREGGGREEEIDVKCEKSARKNEKRCTLLHYQTVSFYTDPILQTVYLSHTCKAWCTTRSVV